MRPKKPELTVIIPVFFNQNTIKSVVENIRQAWQKADFKIEHLEFVLVDDFSGDDSWKVLQEIRKIYPSQVMILKLSKNHGSQLAILAGASIATGKRVAVIAADGQEPPELIVNMTKAAFEGTKLILAVRKTRADTLSTRLWAGFFYRLIRSLGLSNMPKDGFDAFLMDRDLMELILEMRDPNIPLSVTIAWLGQVYKEVSYDRLERVEGKSRWTFAKKFKLALDSITAVSYLPIRLISLFGVMLALLGFTYALFLIVYRLFYQVPVQGWTTLMVIVLVIGGTQLISLGVIGEYLWRTLEVSRRRPLWRISEKEDLETKD